MNKKILEELEFEKNKREILKRSKVSNSQSKRVPLMQNEDELIKSDGEGETKKYAWEYELENYRKSKAMDKFHTLGAICGILALIMTLLINWNTLIQFLKNF